MLPVPPVSAAVGPGSARSSAKRSPSGGTVPLQLAKSQSRVSVSRGLVGLPVSTLASWLLFQPHPERPGGARGIIPLSTALCACARCVFICVVRCTSLYLQGGMESCEEQGVGPDDPGGSPPARGVV